MAEAQQIVFNYKELVELMLEKQGITEGLWAFYAKFGLAAANVGPGPEALQPAAIVPLLEIGVQRADQPSSLTVDASKLALRQAPKRAAATPSKPSRARRGR